MKKTLRRSLLLVVSAIFFFAMSLFFVACAEDKKTITMTFVTGEDATQISAIEADAGADITPPSDPEKAGFTFDGWYLHEDFSGKKQTIPAVMPQESVTYYAKFTALQTATLTLDATEYGTLSTATCEVVVGENVAAAVADIIPQGLGDAEFYGWYDGYQALSSTKKMPAKGLKLTAKYSVKYTLSISFQNANDDNYTIDPNAGETTEELSGLVGEEVDYSDDVDFKTSFGGYTFNSSKTNALTLGTEQASNVYSAYFDRKKISVTYLSNAPADATETATGTVGSITVRIGSTLTITDEKYSLAGYRFAGWSLSDEETAEGETSEEKKLRFAGDTYVASSDNVTLYAQWNREISDAYNASGDKMYVLKEKFDAATKTGKALLVRDGLGEKEISYRVNETTGRKEFSFETTNGTQFSGRISADGKTFAYLRTGDLYDVDLVKYDYVAQKTDANTKFVIDGIDGATYTYTKEGDSQPTVVTGVYTLYNSSTSEYVFVPDESFTAAGEKGFYFRLGTLSDTEKTKVFQPRDGHYGVYYATSATQSNPYPFLYFDGYGTAYKYTSATSATQGRYEFVEKHDYNYVTEDSDGGETSVLLRLSTARYQECDAVKGSYSYQINNKDVTVTLNGFGSAVYAVEGNNSETVSYSIAATYSLNGVQYAYVTYKTYVLRIDLTEGGTGTTLIASDEQYGSIAETAAKNSYGATLFFLGDEKVTVYVNVTYSLMGYTFTQSLPFATGTYTVDDDGLYTLALAEYYAFGNYTAAQAETLLAPYYNGVKIKIGASGTTKYFVTSDGVGEKTVEFTYGTTSYSAKFDGFGVATTTATAADNTTSTQDYTYTYLSGMDYTAGGKNYTFVSFAGIYLRLAAGETAADVVNFLSDFDNRLSEDEILMVFTADGDADILEENDEGTAVVVKADGTYTVTDSTDGVYSFTSSEVAPYASFNFKVSTSLGIFLTYKENEAYKIEGEDRYLTDGYGYFNSRYLYSIDGAWVYVYSASSGGSFSSAGQFKIVEDVIKLPDDYANTYYSYELVEGEIQFGKTGIVLDGYGAATKKTTSGDTEGTYVINADGTITATFGGETIKFKTGLRANSSTTYSVYIPENTAWEETYKCGETTYTVDKYGETSYVTGEDEAQKTYRAYFVVGEDSLFADRQLAYLYVYNAAGSSLQGYVAFVLTEAGGDKTLAQFNSSAYGACYFYENGRMDASYALLYDGLGNVYYKTPDGTTKGKAESTGNTNEYRFVPDETAKAGFVYKLESQNNYTVYKTYAKTYDAVTVAGDWRALTTDGYGNATLVGKFGTKITLSYRIVKENVLFLYNTSGYRYYFAIDAENGAFAEVTEEFIVDGDTLLAYTGSAEEVTLPDTVTKIATDAFYGNFYVQTVRLSNVTKIDSYAFYGCVLLKTIDLSKVTEIGAYAFGSCMTLAEIDLTATTSLGAYAFASCSSLTAAAIPAGVSEIPTGAFYGCTKLASVTNTDHVTKVGAYAFYGCTALTSVTFGEALTEIGAYAFASCATAKDAEFALNLNGATAPKFGSNVLYNSGKGGCRIFVKDMATLKAWLAKDVALGTYINYLYVQSAEVGYFEYKETAEGEEEKRTALLYLGENSRAVFLTTEGSKVFFYEVSEDGTLTLYAYSSEEDCGYVAYTGTISGDNVTVEIDEKSYAMTKVAEDDAEDEGTEGEAA